MPLGTHLIIDARNCDNMLLSDLEGMEKLMVEAVEACGVDVVGVVKKQSASKRAKSRTGNGMTLGILIGLGDSHATITTYPELGKWIADILICGRMTPNAAFRVLRTKLGGHVTVTSLERG